MLLLLACSSAPPPPSDTAPVNTCAPLSAAATPDRWGGDARVDLGATGYFHTSKQCDRWWLVDPDGGAFYSFGVNTVTRYPSASQVTGTSSYTAAVVDNYADEEAWADGIVARWSAWGLNTIGSWSETSLFTDRLPTMINLHLSGGDWESGAVADWWSPTWESDVAVRVAAGVQPANPYVIGYFLDNEIRWGRDWRGPESLVELYLSLSADAPGKEVAVDALYDRYDGLPGIEAAFGRSYADRAAVLAETDWPGVSDDDALVSAFLATAAERYFSFTTASIRAADADHLILGNRESAPVTRREVYEAAAVYSDVVSINAYVYDAGIVDAAMTLADSVDPAGFVAALAPELDRPFVVSEFGFRAADAGLPNSWPPFYPTYATQSERADAFEAYAGEAQATPWIVGYHWFEFVDQPPEGRFDGEDNNWGLVDAADTPYPTLTDRMAAVNPGVYARFEQAAE